ncbi:argininosuccinate lyase [Streptomyces sp. NPDC002779]|uniref:argininosuccinate lyase n=1 Tax=Streptomyces sp. NPDC002779 TaxID=3364664 RepID=UPI0036A51131
MGDSHATGRISQPVLPGLRRILYGATADHAIDHELGYMTAVDHAHLLMLAGCGIVPEDDVRTLLRAVSSLEEEGYAPLRGRHAPRGLYLLYEKHLAGMVGEDTAGRMHTGRSRNDLKATVCRLRLREEHATLLRETLRTEAVALSAAHRWRDTVMSGFTHFQPSVPMTFGFYLLGFAAALGRESERLLSEVPHLSTCPLGAGAMAGTDLAIDPSMTAGLLGFSAPTAVALDAVASRDSVTHVLATAASMAVTASRAALDLQMWSATEPELIEFPDHLVGSSSAMPQKRNAYLLEQLRGRAAKVVGALTCVLTATKSAPFTNSIEVGTEAVDEAWPAFESTVEILRLLRMHFIGARPRQDRMVEHAERHFTTATAVANRLAVGGYPFRQAHEAVGALITAREAGREVEAATPLQKEADTLLRSMDVHAAVAACSYGGGPSPESFDKAWTGLRKELRHRWDAAGAHLDNAGYWRSRLKASSASFADPASVGAEVGEDD